MRQNFDFDHYEKQSKVLKIEVGEADVKTEDEYQKKNPIMQGKTLMDDDDDEGSKRMKASVNVDYDFIPSNSKHLKYN